MSVSKYLKMLQGLLPRGKAWDPFYDPDTLQYKFILAMSDELVRMDARIADLLREADPAQTNELLAQWESMLGLPDPCIPGGGTLTQRRNQISMLLSDRGGQSRQYFINLAKLLGFTVTITEFRPFLAGFSHPGNALTNGLWIFTWQVNAPQNTIFYFSAGQNTAGDALAVWGNAELECLIRQRAPAHTQVNFAYS